MGAYALLQIFYLLHVYCGMMRIHMWSLVAIILLFKVLLGFPSYDARYFSSTYYVLKCACINNAKYDFVYALLFSDKYFVQNSLNLNVLHVNYNP